MLCQKWQCNRLGTTISRTCFVIIHIISKQVLNENQMRNKIFATSAALLSLVGCAGKKAVEPASNYPQDVITAKDGTEITLTFYAHASIAVEALGYQIYVDPVGENVDWAQEPKADLVLVTHDHYDHYDAAAKVLCGISEVFGFLFLF